MSELFTKNLIPEYTLAEIFQQQEVLTSSDLTQQETGQTYIRPTIIGGILEGASFRSNDSGARIEIFPEWDKTIGMIIYDDADTEVFKTIVSGANVGDVVMGDESGGKYAKWDKSATTFTVYGAIVTNPVITGIQSGSEIAIQQWQSTLTFAATDYRIVAWTLGVITLMDGTTYNIIAGNTGNMSALTYIYFDKAISTTTLQVTTTAATAVGTGKILLAVAQNVSDVTKYAKFQVFSGSGGVGGSWIAADNIIVTNLAAISADLGAITAGNITIDSSGFIKGGQTAYNAGTGFFLGYSTDAYKFSIGVSTGQRLTWDGTTLTVIGSLVPVAYPTPTILASADTQRSTTNLTYIKVKEITIQFPGEINVYFEAHDGSDCTVYARVYRNDVAVGTEQHGVGGGPDWFTFSENITGWSIGDKVQLYYKRVGGGGGVSVQIQNFRVRCNILSASVDQD